jgi:hypothetical protein
MNKQPEALRLADALDHVELRPSDYKDVDKAAAELRRLHDLNGELLEALKQHGAHHGNCDYMILLTSLPPMRKPCSCGLHAAIAKAEGEKA